MKRKKKPYKPRRPCLNKHWDGATCQVQEPDGWEEPAEHGTHEKFVCRCGCDAFRVYSMSGYYKTYVECLGCGACDPSESCLAEGKDSTVVHSG